MPTFNTGLSIGGATTTISLEVNETSTNTGANTSNVHYRLVLYRSAGSQSGGADFNVVIDGGQRAAGSNVSFNITSSSPRVFAEGDVTIGHNGDGSKTISVNAFVNTGSGSGNAGGNVGLTNIPRYAELTYFNFDSVTDERIQWSWAANANCDYVSWWSPQIDGNAHHDIPVSGSGNFTISRNNLTSGTQYQIYVAQRRAESGLWRENGPFNTTTGTQNNFMDFFEEI